jgi:hypothetical protein
MNKVIKFFHSNEPRDLIPLSIASFILAYLLGSRAIDTGSLWQYLGVIILVLYGFRYLYRAASPRFRNGKEG